MKTPNEVAKKNLRVWMVVMLVCLVIVIVTVATSAHHQTKSLQSQVCAEATTISATDGAKRRDITPQEWLKTAGNCPNYVDRQNSYLDQQRAWVCAQVASSNADSITRIEAIQDGCPTP